MSPDLCKALKRWVRARAKADLNPKLLIKNHAKYSNLCAARMVTLHAAENNLNSFENKSGTVPAQLAYWWLAQNDAGCSSCWLSSGPKKHLECELKIKRWFEAREALEKFAATLMGNK